jgi:hypothetical protein
MIEFGLSLIFHPLHWNIGAEIIRDDDGEPEITGFALRLVFLQFNILLFKL